MPPSPRYPAIARTVDFFFDLIKKTGLVYVVPRRLKSRAKKRRSRGGADVGGAGVRRRDHPWNWMQSETTPLG